MRPGTSTLFAAAALAALAAAGVVPGAAAAAGVRFAGLERLYFERVTDLDNRFTTDQRTGRRALLPLPARLPAPAPAEPEPPAEPPARPEAAAPPEPASPPEAALPSEPTPAPEPVAAAEPASASEPALAPEPASAPETGAPSAPASAVEPAAPPETASEAPTEEELLIEVNDFPLPVAEGEPALLLRQVVSWPESRIKEVYWALYEDGRRQDVWFYSPVSKRSEGKVLPNHRLTGVGQRGGRIVLQGVAEWDPAGGAYSERGERFLFRLEKGELRFELALAPYGFFQSEEVVEKGGGDFDYILRYAAFVERLLSGPEGERIERRAVGKASDELVARCVARGESGEPCLECGDPAHAARCLAEAPEAVVTYRSPAEPSFVEVGGQADGWE